MSSRIIEANQRVHAALLGSGQYQKSPHRSAESMRRVQSILSNFPSSAQTLMHLDVGCGDGFIFECKPAHWVSIGVDATPEMLDACAANHPDVRVQLGQAEDLVFEDSSFDIVTSYSFLDHLESTERFYAEVLRVLKPGGIFYFGLNPNRCFYQALAELRGFAASESLHHADLTLELLKAFDDGAYYQENFGINKEDLLCCEPGKSERGGMSPTEEQYKLARLGANLTEYKYEWIFQQNRLPSDTVAKLVDFLPFTSRCFKYFDLNGVK